MELALALYIWASLWTAFIAARLPEAPQGQLELVFGSILMGLLWPITLPLHLMDIPWEPTKNARQP